MQKKILIAEDEALMRQTIESYLVEMGFAVKAVENGEACLAAMQQNYQPDAVILDVTMPGLGGLDVLQWIRQKTAFADLPTAVLTASNQADVVRAALRLGVTDYLIKPFTKAIFQTRVRDLTFTLTYADVRLLLTNLRLPDTTLFRAPGLSELDAKTMAIYPSQYEKHSVCLAMPFGIGPKAVAKLDDVEMTSTVQVYVKRMQVWRRLVLG